MAHWIDKKQKTRISDSDYNILSMGKKTTIGLKGSRNEGIVFGNSPRDYIEMNIFNTNGTFLDSIRLDEPNQYVNTGGQFDINPGIILRRNGYFSGDYDIEFSFFREIAGSNQTVLVDSNKKIYTGEYDVLIDGSIVEQGTEKELEELDYKYYVHQVSNDKKEVRLATLPIKDKQYKKEFSGLGEQSTVIYPTLEGISSGKDILKFKNPASNTSTEFTLDSNSNITLDKSLIGGELMINDAFEIMDLTDLGVENDGFSIGCHKVGNYVFESIKIGDKSNGTGSDYFYNNLFSYTGTDGDFKAERNIADIAAEIKGDSGIPFFGGAYTIGYKTIALSGGFPIEINTTVADLNKINESMGAELTATIKGRDLVDSSNTFENTSGIKFFGNGTKTLLPISTNHQRFGGLYDVEFNLTFEVNGARRGIKIYRPNLFCVLPSYKNFEGLGRALEKFTKQGINY
jgi:hypothetical protein